MTVIFSDGFESGNTGSWTATTVYAGCTLATETTLVHHGGYAAEATTNGAAAVQVARLEMAISPTVTVLYVRFYAQVKSHDISVTNDRFYFIRFGSVTVSQHVAWVGWRHDGTAVKWELLTRNGTAYASTYSSTPSLNLNQWYCIELYWLEAAVNGGAQVYIDGVLTLEDMNNDTNDYGDCNRVFMGIAETANTVTADVVVDCCVISDSYIGPEVSVKRRLLMGVGL